MIRPVCRDMFFLMQKSTAAVPADAETGRDLLDTLAANRSGCVGMAANMIGKAKRIIVFTDEGKDTLMYNPVITAKSGRYETEEGCLSLSGTRKCVRYEKISVSYLDAAFIPRTGRYSGFTAEIIQHEMDHLDGIII